jgi:hypothetical protein
MSFMCRRRATFSNSLTHRYVAKPFSPKNVPRRPKIRKHLFCPPQAASGYASADELNPQFTTGEKHEENHYQDRRHHVIAVSSGRIFRSG